MDMRKLVGRNLKRIRLEKGLTQEQFAERSGFTQQYLSDLERGRRNPTIVSLYEIALALGVDQVALVNPDEEAREEEARRAEEGKRGRGTERTKAKDPTLTKNKAPDKARASHARERPEKLA
jgi:transcriptional regulator with XRE-family HTH domain